MLRPDSPNHPRQTASEREKMVNSLTSDLTASVTSEDLTQRDSLCYNSDNLEDSLYGETDRLLGKNPTLRKPQILNLTHIDDISFADE